MDRLIAYAEPVAEEAGVSACTFRIKGEDRYRLARIYLENTWRVSRSQKQRFFLRHIIGYRSYHVTKINSLVRSCIYRGVFFAPLQHASGLCARGARTNGQSAYAHGALV